MPQYDYHCGNCGVDFTELMSIREHGERVPECPKCHHLREVERRLSRVNVVTTKKS
jgi:putative FmdB family regulatory protein